jgi:hypothetical protein
MTHPLDELAARRARGIRHATVSLRGKRVRVYRNLHNGMFSVEYQGKVVAHMLEVSLIDVEFRVQEAGRRRVLRERAKNVHAFVVGTIDDVSLEGLHVPVTYNPYMHQASQNGSFVKTIDKTPVGRADKIHMTIVQGDDGKKHAAMFVCDDSDETRECCGGAR